MRPREPRRRHRHKSEEVYHGVRACAALFARRPQAIVRVYLTAGRQREFRPLLEWCGRERRGFQVVEADNLQRITGGLHHEGIAILAAGIPRLDLAGLLERMSAVGQLGGRVVGSGGGSPLVYLDGVQNPHNLGSILRTAAHFGVTGILGAAGELPPLSPSAVRVAEGAAEHVPVVALAEPPADLARLKAAGFQVVGTASGSGTPLPQAAVGPRPIFVLGSEGHGMSPGLAAAADLTVRIPGTGVVESLNVAVACGILLADAWRRSGDPFATEVAGRPRRVL
jgi:TrmH RNA methyltransferase